MGKPLALPIQLGTGYFGLVEPERDAVREYNRWYERDHFYAACLVGPGLFAGRRWVATRDLKVLRYPADSPVASPVTRGSFMNLYWILRGMHDEYVGWAVEQEGALYEQGRMFAQRDHVYSVLTRYDWGVFRDDDGVPAELSLDHPYRGLVVVIGERSDPDPAALEAWYRAELPGRITGTPVAMCLSFGIIPLREDAPGYANMATSGMSITAMDRRFVQAFFVDTDPRECWDSCFKPLGAALERAGVGRALFVAPFVPTLPGTDAFLDELW